MNYKKVSIVFTVFALIIFFTTGTVMAGSAKSKVKQVKTFTIINVPGDHETIQGAIDAAPSGVNVKIKIAPGRYEENIIIEDRKKLRLRAFGGAVLKSASDDPVITILGSSEIWINGFEITGGSEEGIKVEKSKFTMIRNCYIHGNEVGIYVKLSKKTRIVNNMIVGNEKNLKGCKSPKTFVRKINPVWDWKNK